MYNDKQTFVDHAAEMYRKKRWSKKFLRELIGPKRIMSDNYITVDEFLIITQGEERST